MTLDSYVQYTAEKYLETAIEANQIAERGAAVVREARKRGSIPVLNAGQSAPDADYAELERRADALYGLFCEGAPEKPVPDSRVFVRKTDACEPLHDTL